TRHIASGQAPGKAGPEVPASAISAAPARPTPAPPAGQPIEARLDADHRATLPIGDDVEGWCTVSGGGVRALVYVRPRAELRVSAVPTPPELDAVVAARAESSFHPLEELTDRFYVVLAELHAQVQRWEATAPPAARMTPAVMAGLWQVALDACVARGERVDDA